jgi:hypothetical protein
LPQLLAEPEAKPGKPLIIQIPSGLITTVSLGVAVWITFSILNGFITQLEANRHERWNPQLHHEN